MAEPGFHVAPSDFRGPSPNLRAELQALEGAGASSHGVWEVTLLRLQGSVSHKPVALGSSWKGISPLSTVESCAGVLNSPLSCVESLLGSFLVLHPHVYRVTDGDSDDIIMVTASSERCHLHRALWVPSLPVPTVGNSSLPFLFWCPWGSERVSDLPKVTQ